MKCLKSAIGMSNSSKSSTVKFELNYKFHVVNTFVHLACGKCCGILNTHAHKPVTHMQAQKLAHASTYSTR